MGNRIGVDWNVRLIIEGFSRTREISGEQTTKSLVTAISITCTSHETDVGERIKCVKKAR